MMMSLFAVLFLEEAFWEIVDVRSSGSITR